MEQDPTRDAYKTQSDRRALLSHICILFDWISHCVSVQLQSIVTFSRAVVMEGGGGREGE